MTRLEERLRIALREAGEEARPNEVPSPVLLRRVRVRQARNAGVALVTVVALAAGGILGVRALAPEGVREPASRHTLRPAPAPAACVDGWIAGPAPVTGPGRPALVAIAGSSASDLWAVGATSEPAQQWPLLEHWDGRAWSRPKDAWTGRPGALVDIATTGPDDVWAAGWRDTRSGVLSPLLEHWDGRAWSLVSTPSTTRPDASFAGVAAAGPNDVWVLGHAEVVVGGRSVEQPWVEHWDGTRWTAFDLPTVPRSFGSGSVTDIAVDGGAEVWVGGTRFKGFGETSTPAGGLFLRLVAGSWRKSQAPPGLGGVQALVVLSPGTGWALSAPSFLQGHLVPPELTRWVEGTWTFGGSLRNGDVATGIASPAPNGGVWVIGRRGPDSVPFVGRSDDREWHEGESWPRGVRASAGGAITVAEDGTAAAVFTERRGPNAPRNLLWRSC